MLIGLSASLCFPDMVVGEVDPLCVEKIITRTAYPTVELFVEEYRNDEWLWRQRLYEYRIPEAKIKDVLDRVEALFRKFFEEGRIEQSRLTIGMYPDIYEMGIHWVRDEKQIQWRND